MVAVHTLDALGTEEGSITSSIPVAVPRAGEEARTVYSPIASRLSTELRMPSQRGPMRLFIESDFAGAGRTIEASARVPPDQPLRRRPDLVHVFGSGGRHHRDRLRRPECHLAVPAAAVSLDAERHGCTLPVGLCRRESRARSHGCRGPQLHARLHREAEIPAGPKTGTGALHGSHPGVAAGQAVARRSARPVGRRARHWRHRREHQRRPRAALDADDRIRLPSTLDPGSDGISRT